MKTQLYFLKQMNKPEITMTFQKTNRRNHKQKDISQNATAKQKPEKGAASIVIANWMSTMSFWDKICLSYSSTM